MIKVFTTNKNGKIEFTKDELKKLLDEAYWEGYRASGDTYTYLTPNWQPYCWNATVTAANSSANSTLTLNSNTTSGTACDGSTLTLNSKTISRGTLE